MGWFNRKIALTFIDDATGAVFATSQVPPGDLPESFEIATTLHLGEEDWSVVSAEPRTRSEYTQSGALTLRLRRIEKINPNELLFSLPSICDRLAAVGEVPLAGNEYVLADDDWRQFEFVSHELASEADEEIKAILRVHREEGAEIGWRKLHVRRRPDPPIGAPLTLKDIDRAFGGGLAFRGVAYCGAGSPVASGYSFLTADGLQCYGAAEDGRVTVFAIGLVDAAAPPVRSAAALAEIARRFDLDLVDWCRCVRASADSPLFQQLLLGTNPESGMADHAGQI